MGSLEFSTGKGYGPALGVRPRLGCMPQQRVHIPHLMCSRIGLIGVCTFRSAVGCTINPNTPNFHLSPCRLHLLLSSLTPRSPPCPHVPSPILTSIFWADQSSSDTQLPKVKSVCIHIFYVLYPHWHHCYTWQVCSGAWLWRTHLP